MGLGRLALVSSSSALDVCLELTLSQVSEQSQLTHFIFIASYQRVHDIKDDVNLDQLVWMVSARFFH